MHKTTLEKKKKSTFVQGPIASSFIGESIAKHQTKTDIGAHNIFLGQVRKDKVGNKEVAAIEYTAYQEMAEEVIHNIREAVFQKFDLTCMHIYHSLGVVAAGEICLFVFVSSKHRYEVYQASRFVVEAIKKDVPIFGKEIFADNSHQWKENKI